MQNQMNKYRRLKNLFLRQSYLDAWEDYQRSILKKSFPKWDYIVLTASNEEQGKAFQKQIEYRSEKGVLPDATKFLVIPDPDGKRIGSGGATLHVLRTLSEREGFLGDFHGKRIPAETANVFRSIPYVENYSLRCQGNCRMEEDLRYLMNF